MKKYIGTKQIEAEPMTMGEAYERGLLKAGRVPGEAHKDDAGYHVKYNDGYESWRPAKPFEEAYRVADTPLERMCIEGEELTIRLEKLQSFIGSEKYLSLDNETKAMLVSQESLMMQYQHCLNMRYAKMENGVVNFDNLPFGTALNLLRAGFCVRRRGWNGKGLFVVKQVPAHITEEIIPKMQSLPQSAKDIIMARENKYIDYTNQMLIVNPDGRADSWVPSSSDVFAEDWEIALD